MKIQSVLLVVTLGLVALVSSVHADGKRLVVVVAKGSRLTSISRSDLKRCFLGDSVTGGGRTLIPLNATAGTPERVGFDKAVLGMSAEAVGRYWVDRKVRGEGGPPRSLRSAAHIARAAARLPGAIGYLTEDRLTADVQAVRVDGFAYTDARYDIAAQ